ncbi:hypothetical protein JOE57_001607 [Microlunatus panaciterrae]|uniref:Uncharacterized protein n=1 Tax=Microlunatus panaciterrae TaxID=400768 RepID=A0ABS2RI68_9ACTN|nr:hypothetical protein [Microlunatus panaciterrae]MBM7798686.1 hypothetical protein [Microlunatus panaciterrae]
MTLLIIAIICGVLLAVYIAVALVLKAYDLHSPRGWLLLLLDCTWSLPNTLLGTLIGLPLYAIFGRPSAAQTRGQGWVSFAPRSTTGFGNNVLQTLGTVNLGSAGQHERMHLLQARLFGPAYLPIFALSYVVTFLVQGGFTLLVGLILKATGVRRRAALQPPGKSAVHGFFGWIYYATPFEVWAYASGNP